MVLPRRQQLAKFSLRGTSLFQDLFSRGAAPATCPRTHLPYGCLVLSFLSAYAHVGTTRAIGLRATHSPVLRAGLSAYAHATRSPILRAGMGVRGGGAGAATVGGDEPAPSAH
eukprot:3471436-Rhodomonas_salina.1